MRPKNNLARERLDAVMLQTGLASAITLSDKLGVSVQTLHRILHERGDQIVRLGSTKRAQFALRRLLRGKKAPIPVYLINTSGQGTQVGFLCHKGIKGSDPIFYFSLFLYTHNAKKTSILSA